MLLLQAGVSVYVCGGHVFMHTIIIQDSCVVCMCMPSRVHSACLVYISYLLHTYSVCAKDSRTKQAKVPALVGLTFYWEREKRNK